MPRASAADAAETARRVLDAALHRFAADGFAGASMDDIAADAAVTRGAVYHHYGSKAGLLAAVVAQLQQSVADAVVAAAGDAPPAAALRLGSHAFLDAITADGRARVLLVDAPAVLGWEAWRRSDAEASAVHLREALADAGTPEETLGALTALLSGAMNEAALWLAERPRHAASRRVAHEALDRLLDAVAP
ncbi:MULTISPECIES: TetR/AcrR family transcriptional regulator [Microbacterium]|uniref:TetR/AcrR family transcriptional regulator n=1 Tax=Microbacterium TaxID=33882 RepID=UPI00217EDA93|nr:MULTISPECIES: TetR/AcrR family transcriptional regulator [Microbacterium]UWF77950.1 TetR/AcrR family transcriptional regulator [Microbacterium neungamense]WCM56127.1 TetR/AcrR family transcriptional regulator [Microbacterium sp. EF45047]